MTVQSVTHYVAGEVVSFTENLSRGLVSFLTQNVLFIVL